MPNHAPSGTTVEELFVALDKSRGLSDVVHALIRIAIWMPDEAKVFYLRKIFGESQILKLAESLAEELGEQQMLTLLAREATWFRKGRPDILDPAEQFLSEQCVVKHHQREAALRWLVQTHGIVLGPYLMWILGGADPFWILNFLDDTPGIPRMILVDVFRALKRDWLPSVHESSDFAHALSISDEEAAAMINAVDDCDRRLEAMLARLAMKGLLAEYQQAFEHYVHHHSQGQVTSVSSFPLVEGCPGFSHELNAVFSEGWQGLNSIADSISRACGEDVFKLLKIIDGMHYQMQLDDLEQVIALPIARLVHPVDFLRRRVAEVVPLSEPLAAT